MTLYQHDGAKLFRFELRGDLLIGLAQELERSWHTTSSIIGSRAVVVDVTAVNSWDEEGLRVLVDMQEKGVTIQSSGKDQRLMDLVRRFRLGEGKTMVA